MFCVRWNIFFYFQASHAYKYRVDRNRLKLKVYVLIFLYHILIYNDVTLRRTLSLPRSGKMLNINSVSINVDYVKRKLNVKREFIWINFHFPAPVRQSVALNFVVPHTMSRTWGESGLFWNYVLSTYPATQLGMNKEFGGKWGNDCLNIRFPGSLRQPSFVRYADGFI